MVLLGDFQKSIAQMLSGPFLGVLFKSLALTFLLLVLVGVVLGFVFQWVLPDTFSLPWIGEIGFVDEVLSFAALPVLLLLSPFLMFPVAALFVGLFLDEVAGAVEARHYPELPAARHVAISESLIEAIRFAGVFLLVNALALLIYLFVPPLAPFVFWAVNGFLLGREYFTQVAQRRLPRAEAAALRSKHSARIWFAGVLMAVPLSIPVFNLIIPILGVATFTHQFQRLRLRA